MKQTTKVSLDGLNTMFWEKDKIYDAPLDLALSLIKGNLAVEVKHIEKQIASITNKQTKQKQKINLDIKNKKLEYPEQNIN